MMNMVRRGVAVLAVLTSLVGVSKGAAAADRFVPGEYETIQGAIDAADDGDVVHVGPGVYPESILWEGKAIALVGAGAGATIVDPSAGGRCITLNNVPGTARLEGITCQNGVAQEGGGVLVVGGAPVLRSCVFQGNTATDGPGGGALIVESSATVERCSFIANEALLPFSAAGGGGLAAIRTVDLRVTDSFFSANRAARGGGMALNVTSRTTVEGCHFESNDGGGLASPGDGDISVRGSTFLDNRGRGGMELGPINIATIEDCVFERNTSNAGGGGLLVRLSDVEVKNCDFIDNRSATHGGGMAFSEAGGFVSDCRFHGNEAPFGGGFSVPNTAEVSMSGCSFQGNRAGIDGGGMRATLEVILAVNDCSFTGNVAGRDGGGAFLETVIEPPTPAIVVNRSIFRANEAGRDGGGMRLLSERAAEVTDCLFDRNEAKSSGGGLFVRGSRFSFFPSTMTLTHCTFFGNALGGVAATGLTDLSVLNSIFWQDQGGELLVTSPAEVSVTYSDVQGGFPGAGNIDADPLFIDAASGDLRLRPDSPCKDAGLLVPGLPPTDLAGNPRVVGPAPDMGAYEITALERVQGLIDDVQALVDTGTLTPGRGNALEVKLDGAADSLLEGEARPAVNQLNAFINQVSAFVRSGKLSPAEGQALIAEAEAIATNPGI
ncbi:right-handed parallel beta-helix repeat-containing protein [Sorangium sp. So ce375]|uniref:right-handed parallel beta-helix repeat-containing protein n=1 Tax=Sorangium sp. So ce375 TaxID=3133306 RepID=UPI003F5B6F23